MGKKNTKERWEEPRKRKREDSKQKEKEYEDWEKKKWEMRLRENNGNDGTKRGNWRKKEEPGEED